MKRYGPCTIKYEDEKGDEYTMIMHPVESMMGEYYLASEVEAELVKKDEEIKELGNKYDKLMNKASDQSAYIQLKGLSEYERVGLERKIKKQDEEIVRLRKALEFYANPETYFAIGFFPDPPCGDFINDFSETELGEKPGKLAREALEQSNHASGSVGERGLTP